MVRRILVVDDEAGLCAVLKDALELEDYQVETCQDAQSAEKLVVENKFDAALLDIFLTDEPLGLALAEFIRAKSPETKVLLMTGFANEVDIENSYSSGVCACIRKPYELDDVIRAIELALDG